jgi:hypothetical protein
VDKSEWRLLFDRLGSWVEGRHAEIEVASLRLGNQVVTRSLPMLGIVYDSREDVLEVTLLGLDHLVRCPREIYVDGPPIEWESLAIMDADGVLQILRLSKPILLPARVGGR